MSTHLELLHAVLADDVLEVDDVLVLETGQDLDLAQRTLAVRLVFEWDNLGERVDRSIYQCYTCGRFQFGVLPF